MKGYHEFMAICTWPEETLAEQRERIVKSILTPEQLAKRELFLNSNKKPKQLKLF